MKLKPFLFLLLSISFLSAGPVLKELQGWKEMSEPLSYQRENLWEYINGAADLFLGYGFVELEAHEFTDDSISFTLDIYDMDMPINAFGVYMAERATDANVEKIGTEAVIIPPYQCLYFKHKYYVKINVFEGQLTPELGKQILEKMDKVLPGPAEYPKEFNVLPAENLVPGSYRFVKESYAGLGELTNCLVAGYKEESGKKYEVFTMLIKDETKASSFLSQLSTKWKKDTLAGQSFYYRKIPYKGYVGLTLKGEQIFGISGLADLDAIRKHLID